MVVQNMYFISSNDSQYASMQVNKQLLIVGIGPYTKVLLHYLFKMIKNQYCAYVVKSNWLYYMKLNSNTLPVG